VKNNTTIIRCREGAQRCGLPTVPRAAFTLVEVLVVMTLLSFIVIALMGVFNSTQAAFRASLTQTDVLESGRAAMNLITGDLRAMSPSLGGSRNSTS
jgi:type II secretory pathway component PulJ